MDIEATLRELDAHEQIRQLTANYSHGVDKRDLDRFASVWHEDATWQPMPDGDWAKGRTEIIDAIRGLWDNVLATHHWCTNHAIEVDGDTATALVDADVESNTPDGAWFRIATTYHDTYECRDGRWGIVQRTAVIHHLLPIAAV